MNASHISVASGGSSESETPRVFEERFTTSISVNSDAEQEACLSQ